MIYEINKSKIEGVYELIPNTFRDKRGSVSKIFHRDSFMELGIQCDFNETLVTSNYERGIIRGFHFQRPPYAQAKTLFAAKGNFTNLVLDLRKKSATYGNYDIFEVDANRANMVYVPIGVANCYCITEKDTIIVYNLTSKYMPEFADGVRYDSIDFQYPTATPVLAEKDMRLPVFDNDYISVF